MFPVNGISEAGHCTCSKGASCPTPGKHPSSGDWPAKATTDLRRISNWIESFPRTNWGGLTGLQSGAFVIDIDPRHGGNESWAQLMVDNPTRLPRTLHARTGGGGEHYWVRRFGEEVRSGRLAPGIDVKGERSMVVIPPSRHASGGVYAWCEGEGPLDCGVGQAPEWLRKLIKERQADGGGDYPGLDATFEVGNRNEAIFHSAVRLLRTGLRPVDVTALFVMKLQRGEIEQSTEDPVSPEVLDGIVQAADTWLQRQGGRGGTQDVGNRLNDMENARYLARLHGQRLMHVTGPGWFTWEGTHWRADRDEKVVTQLADAAMRELAAEAPALDRQASVALLRWAQASRNSGKLGAALDLAATCEGVRAEVEALDRDPWALNVLNGTLDLRTGELRPHDRDARITKLVPVKYDPLAQCPEWERTLELALGGNEGKVGFLRRALGYSLTGATSEQCMFLCWGVANSGKSTILEAIHRALGSDYARSADPTIITNRATDNFSLSSIAQLRGVRFVDMSEAEKGSKLRESLLKQLTGGDTVEAKLLYQNNFTYVPQFKLWLRTNHKPEVRGTDEAIWRRFRVVDFPAAIPEAMRRPRHEVDAALDAEAGGILAWLVRGCQEWVSGGMRPPVEVVEATQVYRGEQDIVQGFVDDWCSIGDPSYKDTTINLFKWFTRWKGANGFRDVDMTSRTFGFRLSALGYPPSDSKVRADGARDRLRHGIQLDLDAVADEM